MSRRDLTFITAAALLAGCAASEPASTTASRTVAGSNGRPEVTPIAPSSTSTDQPLTSVGGTFEIVNTTAGGGEVAIEALRASVEVLEGGTWQPVDAQCDLDPVAPIVVTARQVFAFECELAAVLQLGADVRVVTQADVFGLEEPVRQVIDVP